MPRILTLLVVASLLLTACHKAPPAANQPVSVDTTAKLGDGAYLLSSVTVHHAQRDQHLQPSANENIRSTTICLCIF